MNYTKLIFPTVLAIAVLVGWTFPAFWYSKPIPDHPSLWLAPNTNIAGWIYEPIPINKSAEAVLVADSLSNGEFKSDSGALVRLFMADRKTERENEIGLFVHTPDRCWTEAGWKIISTVPDVIHVKVGSVVLPFERRVFEFADEQELVYFAGLIGGQPVPFRLDHNLSVAMRRQVGGNSTLLRALDGTVWKRLWRSFASREPLRGPKQFVRLSAPIRSMGLEQSDRLLKAFIENLARASEQQTPRYTSASGP